MAEEREFRDFELRVEALIVDAGYQYIKDATLEGIQADFIVWSPDRSSFVVLELKVSASAQSPTMARAVELAEKLRDRTHARRVFLVTPNNTIAVVVGDTTVQYVQERQLVDSLATEFRSTTTQVHAFAAAAVISRGRLFAAMPFARAFDDVFFVGIGGAADQLGLAAYRVDYDDYTGDVVSRIKDSIRTSRVVVADLTSKRPNVLYEMGYAHALGVPVIPICADDPLELPFDVGHENTLTYEHGRTSLLRDPLASRIAGALGIARPTS